MLQHSSSSCPFRNLSCWTRRYVLPAPHNGRHTNYQTSFTALRLQHADTSLRLRDGDRKYGHTPGACRLLRFRSNAAAPAAEPVVAPAVALKFDLPLAVALAGVAFEAYLVATGAEGLEEQSVNGTKTTYTDRKFLKEVFQGVLKVTLVRGSDLPPTDLVPPADTFPLIVAGNKLNGKSDPYAVINVGDSAFKSSVKHANLNPEWNETCYLYVRDIETQMLKIRLYDEDWFKSDDDLGMGMAALQPLSDGSKHTITLDLRGARFSQGSVTLEVEFWPFSENKELARNMTADGVAMPTVTLPDPVAAVAEIPSAVTANVVKVVEELSSSQEAVTNELVKAVDQVLVVKEAEEAVQAETPDAPNVVPEVPEGPLSKEQAETFKGLLSKDVLLGLKDQLQTLADPNQPALFPALLKTMKESEPQDAAPAGPEQAGGSSDGDNASMADPSVNRKPPEEDASTDDSGGISLSQMWDAVAKQLQKAQGEDSTSADSASSTSSIASIADAAIAEVATSAPEPGAVQSEAWRVLAKQAGKSVEEHYNPIAYIDNDDTDTQLWIYRNVANREVVVAFRGTEQIKWKDFVTDLNMTPCSLNAERVDGNAGMPLIARLLQNRTDEIMVHGGFLKAYDSVRPRMFRLVDLAAPDATPENPWRVLVTGHSLGGAIATLAAYELAERSSRLGGRHKVTMYSYGAPRLGNRAFAAAYERLVPDSWRITNANDIIPSVPRLMGYSHVNHRVLLDAATGVTIVADSRDVFGEGKSHMEVLSEIAAKIQEAEKRWDEVYEEIKTNEMQILDSLVNGAALEEHMETFYLEALKQCVIAHVQGGKALSVEQNQDNN